MKRALGKKFTAWLITGCITVASVFTVWAGAAPQPQEFDENGNPLSGYVTLYDEIIVEGTDLYDGKILD